MQRGRGIHHHPGRLGHAEDIRRLGTAGEGCGPDLRRTVDTDRWYEVAEAIEFVDHLHEHFLVSVEVFGGRDLAPKTPGSDAQLLDASIVESAHG